MRGVFISDLHLFSDRSVGERCWESSRGQVQTADCVVLGGDIFDFRWSRLGPLEMSLDAAHNWLANAISINPQAQWVFLMGNHDCQPQFQNRLERLTKSHDQFHWHASHWRIGDHLFLHGDLLEGRGSLDRWSRYREQFHEVHPRGSVGNALYRGLVHTRLHGAVPRIRHTPTRTCRKLLQRIHHWHPNLSDGLRHVVFGHTHVAMNRWRHEEVHFHNSGCGIRHLRYNPVPFEIK